MKRSTFLRLLKTSGIDVALADTGALALPPDQAGNPDAEMPGGYQIINQNKGAVLMWGSVPLGADIIPYLDLRSREIIYEVEGNQTAWMLFGILKGYPEK